MKRLIVLGAMVALAVLGAAMPAQAVHTNWGCPGMGVPAQGRCVWELRKWLHGVGLTYSPAFGMVTHFCVGAKPNPDGSGGNALPFRCEDVSEGQTIWSPGGSSNWGYATAINRSNQNAYPVLIANHA